LQLLFWIQPFLPILRCVLACEQAFSQVFRLYRFSFQWLF